MRKPDFCLCENKGADQCFSFHYRDSTIPLLLKSEISSFKPTDRVVLDRVGNPEDQFSRDAAHKLT